MLRTEEKHYFMLYLLVFFLLWAFSVYLQFYTFLNRADGTLLAINTLLLNLGVWVAPVFIFLKYIYGTSPIKYLKLDNKPLLFILAGVLFEIVALSIRWLPVYLESPAILVDNFLSISFNKWLNIVIFIGLIEEIAFRGFILQKLNEKLPFITANLLTSVLFWAIHVPSLIIVKSDLLTFTQHSLYIFIMSYLFGHVFKITKSLWFVIAAHSTHDLILILLGLY